MIGVYWNYGEAVKDAGEKGSKHAREHEAGLALLGRTLDAYAGIKEYAIRTEAGGKPYLAGYPDLHFNISHSHGMCVCAIGASALGVDVELIRAYRPGLERKVLSPEEAKRLDACKNRASGFFSFWTRKESYLKMTGTGLRRPLAGIGDEAYGGGLYTGIGDEAYGGGPYTGIGDEAYGGGPYTGIGDETYGGGPYTFYQTTLAAGGKNFCLSLCHRKEEDICLREI